MFLASALIRNAYLSIRCLKHARTLGSLPGVIGGHADFRLADALEALAGEKKVRL